MQAERTEGDENADDVFGVAVVGIMLHLVLAVGWGAYLVLKVPGYRNLFYNMGVDLPPPTMLTLALTRLLQAYWFIVIPLAGILLVLDGAILVVLRKVGRPILAWSWLVGIGVLLALFLGVSILSMELPIYKIKQALSASPANGGGSNR